MPLSARNQLSGTVTSVETTDVMAEVQIELGDGQTITSNSVERLGIEVGDEVHTVIKATEVMVDTD